MNIRTPLAVALIAIGAIAVATPVLAQAETTAKTKSHTVQRAKGADGAVDATRINNKGGVSTVDRSKGADGLVDKTATGPQGGTKVTDRSLNADGTVNKTVTTTKP